MSNPRYLDFLMLSSRGFIVVCVCVYLYFLVELLSKSNTA